MWRDIGSAPSRSHTIPASPLREFLMSVAPAAWKMRPPPRVITMPAPRSGAQLSITEAAVDCDATAGLVDGYRTEGEGRVLADGLLHPSGRGFLIKDAMRLGRSALAGPLGEADDCEEACAAPPMRPFRHVQKPASARQSQSGTAM